MSAASMPDPKPFDELSKDLKALWIAKCGVSWPSYDAEDLWDRMAGEQQGWMDDALEREPEPGYYAGRAPDKDEDADRPALFRRWTMTELLAEPDDFAWLVEHWLAMPTYGQIAGEMKTLKSYLAEFLAVGVASGLPIFGKFSPRVARPVVAYVGEGGRRLYTRRIRRICSAMGTTPGELDLHPRFDVAPISSAAFQDSLRLDLDKIEPGLVELDPLYAYHGTAAKAADLHQEGALLNQLSGPCMDVGACLQVVNHFNQTGTGTGLKRITMAGSGEWADSWMLVSHREPADVENGVFRLALDIGSRQWGGTTWDLDISIGRFDVDTGSHDGENSWDLNRGTGTKAGKDDRSARVERLIVEILTDDPWTLTRNAVKVAVGGSREVFDVAFDGLADRGVIRHDMAGRTEAGTTKRRMVWGLSPTSADLSAHVGAHVHVSGVDPAHANQGGRGRRPIRARLGCFAPEKRPI